MTARSRYTRRLVSTRSASHLAYIRCRPSDRKPPADDIAPAPPSADGLARARCVVGLAPETRHLCAGGETWLTGNALAIAFHQPGACRCPLRAPPREMTAYPRVRCGWRRVAQGGARRSRGLPAPPPTPPRSPDRERISRPHRRHSNNHDLGHPRCRPALNAPARPALELGFVSMLLECLPPPGRRLPPLGPWPGRTPALVAARDRRSRRRRGCRRRR